MTRHSVHVAWLLLVLACCRPAASDTAVWLRMEDESLWKSSLPVSGKPVLLYGHKAGSRLAVSADGRSVAADSVPDGEAVLIFDTRQPGARRTIPLSIGAEWFLGTWAPDGCGVLASKISSGMEGTYLGTYRIGLDGRRMLVARPPCSGLGWAIDAQYSPSGQLLAIQGDDWLHVIRLSPKSETVLFKEGIDNSFGAPVWLGEDRLAIAGRERLLLADVKKRTVKPWMTYERVSYPVVYSKSLSKLFIVMQLPADDGLVLHSVDAVSGKVQAVDLDGLDTVLRIFGVTSDGKTALVCARASSPKGSTESKPVPVGLWTVNLDTGKSTLVADTAAIATIMP